jgi:hypothetical protein
MAKKFTWDAWDFDCDGDAYIIAKMNVQSAKKFQTIFAM